MTIEDLKKKIDELLGIKSQYQIIFHENNRIDTDSNQTDLEKIKNAKKLIVVSA